MKIALFLAAIASLSICIVYAKTLRPQSIAFSWPENADKKDYDIPMDPLTQNIPLEPADKALRPPPPRIPSTFDIFVGLSSFRDGFRCGYTLYTGFKRATHPDGLYFGIVDQVNPADATCIIEYCKLAKVEWPNEECKFRSQIKIDEWLADDSRGPMFARHHQQKLVGNQEFCLQLDAHSIFTIGWDTNLVDEWKSTDNEMAVLSTYLHDCQDGYISRVKPDGTNNPPIQVPHLCTTMRASNGCVRTISASMIRRPKYAQMSALWGAGLSFSKCHAERRVPIDSHMLWMFDGEEFLRASHLWTYGYDMYSPSTRGTVIYHNYTAAPAQFEDIRVDKKLKKKQREMGKNRFKLMVGLPFKGLVDTEEWDVYNFGKVRSFAQFLNFSSITFEEGKTYDHSCRQLHWVPYQDPKPVENLLPGWKLHTQATPQAPTTSANSPKVQDKNVENIVQPENIRKEKPVPVNFGTEATILVANPDPEVSFSALLLCMGLGVVILFIVLYTKDGVWINTTKRYFRLQHKARQ
jgi:hypothetical protein